MFESSDDEKHKKEINDVYFKPALNVGSDFVRCSTDKNDVTHDDYDDNIMPI